MILRVRNLAAPTRYTSYTDAFSSITGFYVFGMYTLFIFWTTGLTEGVLSNFPCPSVHVCPCASVFEYLRNRPLIILEFCMKFGINKVNKVTKVTRLEFRKILILGLRGIKCQNLEFLGIF